MKYEFYADVFFLTNFYLDFLAVYAVSEMLQRRKKLLRYLAGSAISSLVGCVLFLVIHSYESYALCINFMVNPGMIIFCFYPAEKRIYGKAFGLMYFVILLLGGSMEWLHRTVASGGYYEVCLLLTAVPVMVFLYILRRKRKNVNCFYEVSIEHKGKKVSVQALYDTGNRLADPYVGEPVHIISKEVYEILGGKEVFSMRLIPFSSVGREKGLLKAFTVEKIRLEWEEKMLEISPVVLAAAEDAIFKNRRYQMILNCSLSEGIESGESIYVHKSKYTGENSVQVDDIGLSGNVWRKE